MGVGGLPFGAHCAAHGPYVHATVLRLAGLLGRVEGASMALPLAQAAPVPPVSDPAALLAPSAGAQEGRLTLRLCHAPLLASLAPAPDSQGPLLLML